MSNVISLKKYSPNDYTLVAPLMCENLYEFNSTNDISTILSLYFQWKEYSCCMVYNNNKQTYETCELFMDEDLSYIEEILLKTQTKNEEDFTPNIAIKVRFEIFRVLYEFNVRILLKKESEFITSVPNKITIFKYRNLPRITLKQPLDAIIKTNNEENKILITEMNIKTMVFESRNEVQFEIAEIFVNEQIFKISLFRKEGIKYIVNMIIDDGDAIEKYCNLYFSFAYPSIKRRHLFKYEDIYNLYKETGYTEKYLNSEKEQEYKNELFKTWDKFFYDYNNKYSKDYIAVDESNQLHGGNSVTLGLKDNQESVWIFHNMCARKEPEYLEASGDLYKARTDYLFSINEKCKTAVWYASKSRWLDRIYTKFTNYCNNSSRLHSVALYRKDFLKSEGKILPIKGKYELNYGKVRRVIIELDQAWAGFSDPLFNVSMSFNYCVFFNEKITRDDVLNTVSTLLHEYGEEKGTIIISIPCNAEFTPDADMETGPSDRLAIIDSTSLLDYISSIEHSIAITKKKFQYGY